MNQPAMTDHDTVSASADSATTTGGAATGVKRTAAVVAATVGAAAAMTSIAGQADAAPSYKVWDRVANCESSQNWHINTGNGFYGGLQFTSSTWSSYGGGKYANRADHATRLEQIEVARRVLAQQGPGAWPVCSGNAGLTRSNGHATSAKLPAHAGGESVSTAATKSHKAKHRHAASTHSTNTTHKAKHASGSHYTVRSGDTLAKIAAKKHVQGGWKALYKANHSTVHNANVIHVGQVLRLP